MSASGVTYQVGVNFQTNTTRAIGGVSRFNSKLQQMAGAYSAARREQQHLINGVSKLGDAARWSFTRLTLPLGIFGANLVKTHGQMESWRIAFRTVLRDVEKGDALMRRAVAFSVSTPFTTEAVVRRVQAHVGEEDEAPIEMLSRLGDIAAGVGRATDTGLTDMSRAYVKLLAKGRVDMESAEPFITAGAGVLRQAADMFYGGERERLYKAMERGEVKWTVMRDAIVAMTNEGGRFYKSMERQAEGILVSWAEVVSGFFVFRDALGEVIVKAYGLHGVLKSVTAWLLTSKDRIREWWGGASALTKSVVAVGGAIALLSGPILAVTTAITGLLVNVIIIGGAFALWKKGIFSAGGAAAGLAAVHGKTAAAGAALTTSATTAAAALRGVAAAGLASRVGPPVPWGFSGKGIAARTYGASIGTGITPQRLLPWNRRGGANSWSAIAARRAAVAPTFWQGGAGVFGASFLTRPVGGYLKKFGISILRAGFGIARFLGPLGALTGGAWLLYETYGSLVNAAQKVADSLYGVGDAADEEKKKGVISASVGIDEWRGQYGDQRLITSKLGLTAAEHSAANLASDQQGIFFGASKGRGTVGYNLQRSLAMLENLPVGAPGLKPLVLDPRNAGADRAAIVKSALELGHHEGLFQIGNETLHGGKLSFDADHPGDPDHRKAILANPEVAALLADVLRQFNEGMDRSNHSIAVQVSGEIRQAVRDGSLDAWREAVTDFMNENNGANDG